MEVMKGSDDGMVLFSNSSLRSIVRPMSQINDSDASSSDSNYILEKFLSSKRRKSASNNPSIKGLNASKKYMTLDQIFRDVMYKMAFDSPSEYPNSPSSIP